MEDFYPFAAAITVQGELKPLAAYLEDNELSVEALLAMLDRRINEQLIASTFRLGAIVTMGRLLVTCNPKPPKF